jgi:uncharacterized protein (TIGR03032 family)
MNITEPAGGIKPVFVIGVSPHCVNSLIAIAAMAPDAWAADPDLPNVIDSIPAHHPEAHEWRSSRLTASDVLPDTARLLSSHLTARVRNRDDFPPTDADMPITVVQDAVVDVLRVPFLASAFPTAKFVFVHRSIPEALDDMEAVWNSRRHSRYSLPGWEGPPWALALIPGWRDLAGCTVSEIVTAQWNTMLEHVIDDLSNLEPGRWCSVSYDRLLADSDEVLRQAFLSMGLTTDERMRAQRSPSRQGQTPTGREDSTVTASSAVRLRSADDNRPGKPDSRRFNMRYSPSFPAVLNELGISLLVTKYDTNGALLCLSERDGDLHALARPCDHPAGIGVTDSALSIGTRRRIDVLRDRLPELDGAHTQSRDACYIPYVTYTTGDFSVREMAYAGRRLHAVSAMFSALCVIGEDQQVTPWWSPPFITSLVPEDRCHLNGLAIVDEQVGYVSALGTTDHKRGWRDGKLDGGVVLDVKTGDVVISGLCVPHSPRWREGRLWLLESGTGSLLRADPVTGGKETVHTARGFNRGLALIGKYAFVGFSPARGNILRGLPIEQNGMDNPGVRIIDTHTGTVVAVAVFEDRTGEVFDIQILNRRFPDVAETDGSLIDQCFISAQAPKTVSEAFLDSAELKAKTRQFV